jgi:hypothetical protein
MQAAPSPRWEVREAWVEVVQLSQLGQSETWPLNDGEEAHERWAAAAGA